MHSFQLLAPLVLSGLHALSVGAAYTTQRNYPFITTANGQYIKHGKPFKALGTNAYWLPTLNTWDDIDYVVSNISSFGFNAIRTWAFNDVDTIPTKGTWFQHIQDGRTTISEGPNGLQKLDKVVRAAERHGVYLILTLTNNWNPERTCDPEAETGFCTARNTLSNDYGKFCFVIYDSVLSIHVNEHDQFYLNEKIVKAFLHYVTCIVSRYKDSPAIFQWEIANDASCLSTLNYSANCTRTATTNWFRKVATHIKSIDPNHLISPGTQGFYCAECLNQDQSPGARRENWERSVMARQPFPEFSGYHNVDGDAITGIHQIDSGSASTFTNQNNYRPGTTSRRRHNDAFEQDLQDGLNWIERQTIITARHRKPLALIGAGMVNENNFDFFVPFNSSSPSLGTNDARISGVGGAFHYQYGQGGLMPCEGTPFPPIPGSKYARSPNDGYSDNFADDPDLQRIFKEHAREFGISQ
ncbi:hypothetical protein AX16_006304 [Volvariella volvacea WC 439]|nr:hypothetical protein AX16_006304 [Volvariella volvacea WC 439]